jgi:hypothetical protein
MRSRRSAHGVRTCPNETALPPSVPSQTFVCRVPRLCKDQIRASGPDEWLWGAVPVVEVTGHSPFESPEPPYGCRDEHIVRSLPHTTV